MPNLVNEYKNIYLGKREKPSNSSKTLSLYWNVLWTWFEVCQKPKLNLLSDWILAEGFRVPNLVDEYKTIFLGMRGQAWNSPKSFSLYWRLLWIYFEVCQKPQSNLLSDWILVEGFRMRNLVGKYKTIFLGKLGKFWNLPKPFSVYWSFLQICFEVWQNPKLNLMGHGMLIQGLRMQNLVDEYKTIFLGRRGKLWSSSKIFSLYWSFL